MASNLSKGNSNAGSSIPSDNNATAQYQTDLQQHVLDIINDAINDDDPEVHQVLEESIHALPNAGNRQPSELANAIHAQVAFLQDFMNTSASAPSPATSSEVRDMIILLAGNNWDLEMATGMYQQAVDSSRAEMGLANAAHIVDIGSSNTAVQMSNTSIVDSSTAQPPKEKITNKSTTKVTPFEKLREQALLVRRIMEINPNDKGHAKLLKIYNTIITGLKLRKPYGHPRSVRDLETNYKKALRVAQGKPRRLHEDRAYPGKYVNKVDENETRRDKDKGEKAAKKKGKGKGKGKGRKRGDDAPGPAPKKGPGSGDGGSGGFGGRMVGPTAVVVGVAN